MAAYLFRLDDITDTIDQDSFDRCLSLLLDAGVKPLLGVIPDNQDARLQRHPRQKDFWKRLASLRDRGLISVALHGLHHVYHENRRSLLYAYGIGPLSEFAGLPYTVQCRKIAEGLSILRGRNLNPTAWMAPNHSFDTATIHALAANNLSVVTDGIGLFPFRRRGITFVPVLSGRPRRIPFGIMTICLHTETMTERDFEGLRLFLKRKPRCLSFEEVIEMKNPFFAGPCCNGAVRAAFWVAKKAVSLARRLNRP